MRKAGSPAVAPRILAMSAGSATAVLVKKLFDEGDDERFGVLPSLCHDFAVGGVDEDFRADNGRIFRIIACARVDKA